MMNQNENTIDQNENTIDQNEDGVTVGETEEQGGAYHEDARFDKRVFNPKGEFVNLTLNYELDLEEGKLALADMIEVMADAGFNVIVPPTLLGEKLMQQEAQGRAVLEIVTTLVEILDENGAKIIGDNGKPEQTAVISGVVVNHIDFEAMKSAAASNVFLDFLALAVHERIKKAMRPSTKIIWVENADTGERTPRLQIGATLPTMPAGIFAANRRAKADIRDGLGVMIARFLSQRDQQASLIWKSIKTAAFIKSLKSATFAMSSSHGMFEQTGKFKDLLSSVSKLTQNPAFKDSVLPKLLASLPKDRQEDEEFSQDAINIFFASDWAQELLTSRDLITYKIAEVKQTKEEAELEALLAGFGK